MRIEDVRSHVSGAMHFVTVHTDTGLTGLGQSGCWAYPTAVAAVTEVCRAALIGQDPRNIERHHQHLYRMGPFRGAVLSAAVSSIDIALWDLVAQHHEVPVYELLGGRYRKRVRLCSLLAEQTSLAGMIGSSNDAALRGYTAIKFDPLLPGYEKVSAARRHADVLELVGEVRHAVGEDVDIILELGRKLTPLEAGPMIEGLAQFKPLFIEDPIQIDSIRIQADLAARTRVPLAAGERLHTVWEFAELLAHGGPQYLRPDPGLCGGFTGLRKIAALGEAHHSAVVTHNFLGPVLTAASVHFDIATPNILVQEYRESDENSEVHAALTSRLTRDGGFMNAPDGIGIGVILNPDHLNAETYDSLIRNVAAPRLRTDGSLANVV